MIFLWDIIINNINTGPSVASDSLGNHPVDDPVHFCHTPILVVESVIDGVLFAQHLAGPVADQVPGESEIPVGVRRI